MGDPVQADVEGAAGEALDLTVTLSVTASTGTAVPWTTVVGFSVELQGWGAILTTAVPAVTSPAPGQLVVSWSAAQTSPIAAASAARWTLKATVRGTGPLPLVEGALTMTATGPTSATVTAAVVVTLPTAPLRTAGSQLQALAAEDVAALKAQLATDLATWQAKAESTPDTENAAQWVRTLTGLGVSFDAHVLLGVAVGILPPPLLNAPEPTAS